MLSAPPSPENGFHASHVELLLRSYERWIGQALLEGSSAETRAQALFHAPFVVLSHNTAADPIFTYGNLTALRLFELTWEELTALPSRRSAEPVHQSERERLLRTVAAQGFIDDYSGVRVSSTGRRFWIERATVWNLVDASGTYCGQAATFSEWKFLA